MYSMRGASVCTLCLPQEEVETKKGAKRRQVHQKPRIKTFLISYVFLLDRARSSPPFNC